MDVLKAQNLLHIDSRSPSSTWNVLIFTVFLSAAQHFHSESRSGRIVLLSFPSFFHCWKRWRIAERFQVIIYHCVEFSSSNDDFVQVKESFSRIAVEICWIFTVFAQKSGDEKSKKEKWEEKFYVKKRKRSHRRGGRKKRALRVFVTYDREYQRKNGKKFGQMCSALFRGEIGFRPFFFIDERGKTWKRKVCDVSEGRWGRRRTSK